MTAHTTQGGRVRRLWQLWLGVALIGAALVLVLPAELASVVLGLVSTVTAVGVVVGIRQHRPERRRAWLLMAAAALTWLVADVVYWVQGIAGVVAFPTLADVGFLAAYPLMAAALLHFTRLGHRHEDRLLAVDLVITLVALSAVMWIGYLAPTWGQGVEGFSSLAGAVASAYVVLDVVLLVMLAQVAVNGLVVSPALRFLGISFCAALVADVLLQVALLEGPDGYLGGGPSAVQPVMYAAWCVMHGMWAAAAAHPSMRTLGQARSRSNPGATTARIALLGGSLFALPVVYLTSHLLGRPVTAVTVASAAVVIIPLVFWRVLAIVRHAQAQSGELARLSRQDDLTGLENRTAMVERLEVASAAVGDAASSSVDGADAGADGGAEGPDATLLVIGLQGLGEISETVGHHPAEEILRLAAARLREAVPRADVARVGGHVFAVLCSRPVGSAPDDDPVASLTGRVRDALTRPFVADGMTLTVQAAVGVVAHVAPEVSGRETLLHGELALETAATQTSRVAVYSPRVGRCEAVSPSLVGELAEAVRAGQVMPWYQPQLDVPSGRVVGLEALVRWEHPRHGLLAPAAFVPAAERTGLVRELTRMMLDRALADLVVWRAWRPGLTVSVNLSVRDLLDPALPDEVAAALTRHGVPAEALELEITETMAMIEPEQAACVLRALADLGVVLSVDDYGAGYGSLAYLQRLPVRRMKIDREFVAQVADNAASRAIVASTVELAAQLGLTVVAEGVERLDDLRWLRAVGCGSAQGYAIARPFPGERMRAEVEAAERRLGPMLAGGRLVQQARGGSSRARASGAAAR